MTTLPTMFLAVAVYQPFQVARHGNHSRSNRGLRGAFQALRCAQARPPGNLEWPRGDGLCCFQFRARLQHLQHVSARKNSFEPAVLNHRQLVYVFACHELERVGQWRFG